MNEIREGYMGGFLGRVSRKESEERDAIGKL